MTHESHPSIGLDELTWLRNLAARLAASGDDDDLVQDTLLARWTARPNESTEQPLRPWLATVLRNRARMQARGRARREQREKLTSPRVAARSGPDDELDRVRALQAVFAALDQLPELDRRIVVRRFLDEENATEIAEHLGIPAATVRSRLRRSLARLRTILDERHGGRREAWMLALVGPAPSLRRNSALAGVLGTITLGGLTALAWSSCGQPAEDEPERTKAAAIAGPQQEPSPEELWHQRRRAIRARLPEHARDPGQPPPEFEREAMARARLGFSKLRRACMEDLATEASGAISLHAIVIGDPEVGTIFDDVEVVAETVGDPEVLACIRESMFAYVGDPPPVAFEAHYAPTTQWVGRVDDDDRKQRRIFEAIVGAHHGEVAFCGREHASTSVGTLSLEFSIGADRRIGSADVISTDLPDAAVECIVTASKRWAFPADLVDQLFEYEFRLPVAGIGDMLPNNE